jgi:RimJ/RimL family protein N-acetyltransferase
MLGFALGSAPEVATPPPGFRVEAVDAAWMAAELPNGRFTNGIGEADNGENRRKRNRFARVVFDASGEPAAVAGVFTTHAMFEIGIDVRREFRGLGLARVAVNAALDAIVRAGETPFYACAATNIRSQRTAATCGFVPALSVAWVFPDADR